MLQDREEGWREYEQVGGNENTISKDKKQTYFTTTDRLTEIFSKNWAGSMMVYRNLKQAEGSDKDDVITAANNKDTDYIKLKLKAEVEVKVLKIEQGNAE